MSHFTKVATKINSLPSLLRALDRLGLRHQTAEGGVEVRGYQGQIARAEVAIDFGRYDVGVVRGDDGAYSLEADWWGIETTAGKTEQEVVASLNREYAFVRVMEACEAQGYRIGPEDVSVAEDGTVQLVATKWG